MTSQLISALIFAAAVTLANGASAQGLQNPVVSDDMRNTAMGTGAYVLGLSSSFNSDNTAAGYFALYSPEETGSFNSAFGSGALEQNSGDGNSAFGYDALFWNGDYTGSYNTAVGAGAMLGAGAGNAYAAGNTAVGYQALYSYSSGGSNVALGYQSLFHATQGYQNIAVGKSTLFSMTTGTGNVASGYSAAYYTTTGISNSAYGYKALFANSAGSNNIALGDSAGYNLKGSHNIAIGHQGLASDNGIIRIGTPSTHTKTYVAGIFGSATVGGSAVPVYVDSDGRLGPKSSSERYKTAIKSLGGDSEKLQLLRPVTYRLKSEPKGALQFGLIAEEVDKVFPELVVRSSDGKIEGVRYDQLAPILVKDAQDRKKEVKVLEEQLRAERDARLELTRSFQTLQAQNAALLSALNGLKTGAQVAMR